MINNDSILLVPQSWSDKLVQWHKYYKTCLEVTLQITEDCCMACTYCYQHNKSKEKMSFDIAKQCIDQILTIPPENHSGLIINLIGGEPLLESLLIEQICEYTISKMIEMHHPWLPYFKCAICSNGLLYFSNETQSLLSKYNFWVPLTFSIDGNQELHDLCRVDYQGQGTYNRVMNAVDHYRKNYGMLYDTKMTLSPDNIQYLYKAVINLIENKYIFIYVNCIFEQGWTNDHAIILYNQLKEIADYLIENNLYNKIFVRFFSESNYIPMLPENNKNWCGGVYSNEYSNFAVDYQGLKYPCIRYMNSSLNGKQPALDIGNIFNNHMTEQQNINISLLSNITRRSQSTDECFNCPIATGCSWCSGYNYEEFGTPNKRATYICCMHKAASLANYYFLNTLYNKLNLNKYYPMYLPKEEAIKIIGEEEYNNLIEIKKG